MTPAAGASTAQARPPGGPRLPWLHAGAAALGIGLSPDQLAAFNCYREALLAANRRTNLTAITDPAAVEIRHFVDSLTCLLAWPTVTDRPMQVIDIGAGAGFPGLPLKLIRPQIGLTLVDSVGKKTAFLAGLVRHLNLEAATVVTARAEDLARQPAYREQYDVALARAVAPAPVLVEYALPFLRVGGRLIAQKTAGKGPDELAACQRACALLGGGPPRLMPVTLSAPPGPHSTGTERGESRRSKDARARPTGHAGTGPLLGRDSTGPLGPRAARRGEAAPHPRPLPPSPRPTRKAPPVTSRTNCRGLSCGHPRHSTPPHPLASLALPLTVDQISF